MRFPFPSTLLVNLVGFPHCETINLTRYFQTQVHTKLMIFHLGTNRIDFGNLLHQNIQFGQKSGSSLFIKITLYVSTYIKESGQ